MLRLTLALALSATAAGFMTTRITPNAGAASGAGKNMVVLGGTGYVGSRVAKEAVEAGYAVTCISRRGVNPEPNDAALSKCSWVSCDATQEQELGKVLAAADPDVLVHAVGLLFDVDSGLKNLNLIVSGSKSVPGEKSTYDAVTRVTAENALKVLRSKVNKPLMGKKVAYAFVSAAEAGWPDVPLGDKVESLAPEWLSRYLEAKRSVEGSLNAAAGSNFRPIIFRPSLIWSWGKLDVLPVIPVFNVANALGVPFVDKTVRVEDLASAIVEACSDESVSGVCRFKEVESLSARARALI
mmetsp:Transcript_6607/g.18810  ORF Transcript_6607/g.18810 Transcript_6607/m.18810 type:complete len:297 (-) Transcript_6607:1567-2457(-)